MKLLWKQGNMERNMKQECVDIKPLLNAYIDNELTDEQSSVVTSHISECDNCKAHIASLYKVRNMIKAVYEPKEDIDVSKKIMANIKFNNKYKKHTDVKEQQVNVSVKRSFIKAVTNKFLYVAAAAVAIMFAIGATVTYFEKSDPVTVEIANQTFDKYEDYVIEHYTNSYVSGFSVVPVNFEK